MTKTCLSTKEMWRYKSFWQPFLLEQKGCVCSTHCTSAESWVSSHLSVQTQHTFVERSYLNCSQIWWQFLKTTDSLKTLKWTCERGLYYSILQRLKATLINHLWFCPGKTIRLWIISHIRLLFRFDWSMVRDMEEYLKLFKPVSIKISDILKNCPTLLLGERKVISEMLNLFQSSLILFCG